MKKRYIKLICGLSLLIGMFCRVPLTVSAADSGILQVNGENLTVYTLQKSGNDNESFVILYFGDGYTQSEQDDFLSDITSRSAALLNTEPFRTYSGKINIYAIPTVSAESGVSDLYGAEKNTYFSIAHYGNIVSFLNDEGKNRAEAIKAAMEGKYLDAGGVVGTTHILSNTDYRFGSSIGAAYSFSSISSECGGGEALVHEMAHSIGRLKDEYGRIIEGVNTSKTNDKKNIIWKKLLGFRGVGITQNGNDPNGYIPTASCMMNDLYSWKFCEVCKIELASKLNSWNYTQSPERYYIANPDLTIEHSDTAVGSDYEKARVSNGNLIKANGHNLELRTVVQNFENSEQTFKLVLKIIDSDGNTKMSAEETITVPPLPDKAFDFEYDVARKSLSVTIENVSGIVYGDKVLGEVIDCRTNERVATNETEKSPQCTVRIHHKIKETDGSVYDMENTYTTTVYVPQGSVYKLRRINGLNGFTYVGNSLATSEVKADGESLDIDFYYRKFRGDVKTETKVSDDGKDFVIKPNKIVGGTNVFLALFYNGAMKETVHFVYNGEDLRHSTQEEYSSAKVLAWEDIDKLIPACNAEEVTVTE